MKRMLAVLAVTAFAGFAQQTQVWGTEGWRLLAP